jgi:hypothetical protein
MDDAAIADATASFLKLMIDDSVYQIDTKGRRLTSHRNK